MSDPFESLPSEEEAEAFFESLAGRKPRADSSQVLRSAILAELRAIRVESVPALPPLADDSRDAATLSRLIQEGVFAHAPEGATAKRANAARPMLQRWLAQLRDLLSPRVWSSALVASAVMVCVLLILPRHDQGGNGSTEVLRGGGQPTITVESPEAFVQSLAAELQALGAKVRVVQISDTQWSLSVLLDRSSDQENTIAALLKSKGFGDAGQPPVELVIRKK